MEGGKHLIHLEGPYTPIVISIVEELKRLCPMPSECCMHRVPHRLGRVEEAAYIPKVVSLGSLHQRKI